MSIQVLEDTSRCPSQAIPIVPASVITAHASRLVRNVQMSHADNTHEDWQTQAYPFLRAGTTKHHGVAHAVAPQPAGDGPQAIAGTWNGPSHDYIRAGVSTAEPASHAPVQLPHSVRLSNGASLPMIGLGTGGAPPCIRSPDVIRDALALGYRHFDCAEFYGNHPIVGEGLKDFIASGRRHELFITSKIISYNFRPEYVWPAVDNMLKQLGCQYLDLLLMHWPHAQVREMMTKDDWVNTLTIDTGVTIMDTWRELEKLVDAGLVKSLGVSNFSSKEVEQLVADSRIKPVVNQVELHPYLPQRKLVDACSRVGVQCVAYAPMGGGGYQQVNTLLTHPVVAQVAKEIGKSASQVLLHFNTERGVPVVPRGSSHEHLKQNIEGAFEWALSPQQRALLDGLENGTRFCNPLWKKWDD